MRYTDAIIIGAGQAGLAMSHCLSRLGITHVVLERGQVAERWRSERWDSLLLLSPNWMSRLPGYRYSGPDPDGFMTVPDYIAYLERYAATAPVVTGTTVRSVRRVPGGYQVASDTVVWRTRCVVIATGHCAAPHVPDMARNLPASICQVTPSSYRNADKLPEGGVLVVGASASGAQLAREIRLSGRPVTIAVGCHFRLPRVYRGRDIMWWLDRTGAFDRPTNATTNPAEPSMQLMGHPERLDIDVGVLRDMGVRIAGRVAGIAHGAVYLQDDVARTVASAQTRLERLLARIDPFADSLGAPAEARPTSFAFPPPPTTLHLAAENIQTIVWATGFKRNYSWLQAPLLNGVGEIVHAGGITASPGLYVLGLRFMRRRNSNFIDGVGNDAAELATDIRRYINATARSAA